MISASLAAAKGAGQAKPSLRGSGVPEGDVATEAISSHKEIASSRLVSLGVPRNDEPRYHLRSGNGAGAAKGETEKLAEELLKDEKVVDFLETGSTGLGELSVDTKRKLIQVMMYE